MTGPKSIILFHRKNLEWLNSKLFPYAHKKSEIKLTIICNNTIENFVKKEWVNKNDIIINQNHLEDIGNSQKDDEKEVYELARKFEKKYNITYFRDCFIQDRVFATKVLSSFSKNPLAKGKKESMYLLTKRQNHFFSYFENFITKNNVDLIIARPDDMIGFTLNTIAEKLNIPSTFQITTRISGYMYWAYGPYAGSNQLQTMTNKIKSGLIKIKEADLKETDVVAGHSVAHRNNYIDALSFKAMMDGVKYTLKDRLNWLIKDIKAGKLGKRVSMIGKISFKINKYLDHRYFQKLFTSEISVISVKPFLYFPLPMEPEYNTHSLSKEFINVHAMAQQLALSLPSGYNIVLKEHTPNIGLKPREFYKSLLKIPNVIFANYLIEGPLLVDKAEAVITISGSTALEAAERGKMAIILGTSVEYMYLPNIIFAHSMRDLPQIIEHALESISDNQKKIIKEEVKLLKHAYKECGYYAPDTPLFLGKSENIEDKELYRAYETLLELWNLKNN
jgi:hypothetical protein